jgi:hypothetical protein
MKKSVIIRGKIFPQYTQESVNSIRKWFNGEIILSTWKNQEINIEGIDKLILSEDPGPGPVQQSKRQCISYLKGLEESSGDTVLVTRSDIIHNKDLFSFFKQHNKYDEKFKIFEDRVVISNMMTIDPDKEHPHIPSQKDKYFRACDWFQVGNKDDLYKWINIDIFEQYKDSGLCTEQLWFGGLIKKHHLEYFDLNDILKYKFLFWNYLLNNFRIINMKTVGKATNLNWIDQPEDLGCYLMQEKYEELYNRMIA